MTIEEKIANRTRFYQSLGMKETIATATANAEIMKNWTIFDICLKRFVRQLKKDIATAQQTTQPNEADYSQSIQIALQVANRNPKQADHTELIKNFI